MQNGARPPSHDETSNCKKKKLSVEADRSHLRDWSFLPVDVLIVIFKKLPPADIAQCSRVCSTWQQVLQDDYVWKQLLCAHWGMDSFAPCRSASWQHAYKEIHLISSSPPTQTSYVHKEAVNDITFSQSGRYLCTASKHQVVMWHVEQFTVFNKLYFKCSDDHPVYDPFQVGFKNVSTGVHYTLFNDTDEFLLVVGMELQEYCGPAGDSLVLVYTFPECFLVKKIDTADDAAVSWFSKYTLLIKDFAEYEFEGLLTVWSVFQYSPKDAVKVNLDIVDVTVVNDWKTMQKYIVYCYIDDEDHMDDEYAQHAHKISIHKVTSSASIHSHQCTKAKPLCCVEARYSSPDPSQYHCSPTADSDNHIGAAIRQIGSTNSSEIVVICRPISKMSQSTPIVYSPDSLDLRIYDLDMNLIRNIGIQHLVPPDLFHFDHDYWHDEEFKTLLLSGDINPGLLQFYHLHYHIHIRKQTGHTKAINCASFSPYSHDLLVSAAEDETVKFWDLRSHFSGNKI